MCRGSQRICLLSLIKHTGVLKGRQRVQFDHESLDKAKELILTNSPNQGQLRVTGIVICPFIGQSRAKVLSESLERKSSSKV